MCSTHKITKRSHVLYLYENILINTRIVLPLQHK